MTKNEYIMEAFHKGAYKTTKVMVSWFVINLPTKNPKAIDDYIVYVYDSKVCVNIDSVRQILTDADVNKPLYKEGETVTTTGIQGIPTGTELPLGRLLKYVVINLDSFEGNIPYEDKNMTVRDYDKFIVNGLHKYLKKYARGVSYLSGLSSYIVVSATRSTIAPPKGIDKFVKKTAKKYDLSDPINMSKLDDEVTEYAKQVLKDDPSLGKILDKKTLGRYLKIFGTFGSSTSFGENAPYVTNSLVKGLPTDAKGFSESLNRSRSGSLDRGFNTQIGGVIFNLLSLVSSGLVVTEEDCGTTRMIEVDVTDDKDKKELLDRYTIDGEGNTVKPTFTKKGMYKIRSGVYCKSPGMSYCRHCVGDSLADTPNGIVQATGEVSRVIVIFYMKAMHFTTLEVLKLDKIDELF